MWPALHQIIDKLRQDDGNPIHACHMRVGPKRKGPELTTEQVLRWVPDATERALIEARTVDPSGLTAWSVTERGRQRLLALRGIKPCLGGVLAWERAPVGFSQ